MKIYFTILYSAKTTNRCCTRSRERGKEWVEVATHMKMMTITMRFHQSHPILTWW